MKTNHHGQLIIQLSSCRKKMMASSIWKDDRISKDKYVVDPNGTIVTQNSEKWE